MTEDILGLLEEKANEEERRIERALRPKGFDEYVGQKELITKLSVSIEAATDRDEPLDHLLLNGPAGLGKTAIAQCIANESNVSFKQMVASSIKTTKDILELLVKTKDNEIIFIDEIHSLDRKIAEVLYQAMEDFKIDVKLGNKEVRSIRLAPFCLVGATTHVGKMPQPLRDRFGIHYTMSFYSDEELVAIVYPNCDKLGLTVRDEVAVPNLARRARGTPRLANRLLRRVRDYAQVYNNNNVTTETVDKALELEGVDKYGFTKLDHKYINVLYHTYNTGPVGIASMAASMGDDESTLEEYVEPFLTRKGIIARTKGGRVLTGYGMELAIRAGMAEEN